jgi:CheY-like chemotaxis protein
MTRPPVKPAAAAGRILVVEDSPSARRLMQDVLLRLGAELPNLRVAGTVVEALTLFSQWRPDVAFVDIELNRGPPPELPREVPAPSDHDPKDGIELSLLMLSRNPRIRIIMCSASDPSDPRAARLVKEGRVEFITKPILAARVEEVLAKAPPPDPAHRA